MKAGPKAQVLALLLGLAVGFAGSVWAGYQASFYSKPSNFHRFFPQLTPQGSFYPPFSMLENLALARAKPGVTLVIIGGNSILAGVGQSESELWSTHLQALLGPRYAVVNLAFSGAYPSEAGALVAESLLRRGLPVIYVANYGPGPVARPYESIYAYLYWDAYYKGRLLPNPPREAELARHFAVLPRAQVEPMKLGRLAGWLDARLWFQELWHHLGYRSFATVWSPVSSSAPWQPKDRFGDQTPPEKPLAERFRDFPDQEMAIVRGFSQVFAEPDGAGGWRPAPGPLGQAAVDIDEVFAAPLRARMLMLLVENCPYYRDQLTASERARDNLVFSWYQALWRAHGVSCAVIGRDFSALDYHDRAHLAPSGGEKLALDVAGRIRAFPPP
jgi:hypothetical protein